MERITNPINGRFEKHEKIRRHNYIRQNNTQYNNTMRIDIKVIN